MPKSSPTDTPMMRQFCDLKRKHPDALLLFRCGDFYETYLQDAVTAANVLGITLTRRNNKNASPIEMAGFPHHALDTYLPRLIRAGHRVAICDQLEDPKTAKGLVKRGITELVTPGVAMSDGVLTARENNFLAAVHFDKETLGLALLDISTGEFLVAEGPAEYVDKLLANFAPKEVLILRGTKPRFEGHFGSKFFVFELDDWCFNAETARERLLRHFGVRTLKGFGVDSLEDAIIAAGAAMSYLEITQHTQTAHITALRPIDEEHYVRLDRFTTRNLELVAPMNEGGRSLLSVLDRTLTPMGARMLHRWVIFPLKKVAQIEARQDGVEYFFRDTRFRDLCIDELAKIGDLERVVSKVAVGRANPRDMQQLRIALESVALIREASLAASQKNINDIGQQLDACQELHDEIFRTLTLDPPIASGRPGVIANGVNAELDELRAISTSGKDYLLTIQQRESEATGIPSLKIGFNNVFGYYIEVRNTYRDQVPQEWIRKQTLAQAERYITQELKEYEEKILGAEDRILALEASIYTSLVARAGQFIALLQRNAAATASLDCLAALAAVAAERGYIRPVVDDSTALDIRQGRHPVIETLMAPGEAYVPNDIALDTEAQQIVIITGPNMAGKSALLRQTALITLMAQIGSFVPAASARIGLVDKIFTRVGASDNISMGESTFMVEMTEAANIMNNITPRSLVLFDELGRGTSTYDGISIAWAIVEHLHENPTAHARTLFATHYHELNEMEALYPRIKNWNVSVVEKDGHVVFLRTLQRGGSEHSFGIHVARLAGMPASIVSRAEQVLRQLEQSAATAAAPTEMGEGEQTAAPAKDETASGNSEAKFGNSEANFGNSEANFGNAGKVPSAARRGKNKLSPNTTKIGTATSDGIQLSFFQLDDPLVEQIRDEILGLDINNLTPLEALQKLDSIRRLLTGGK